MPLETLFTNPNPTVSRSKAVLSRFMKPISKHSRNLTDFFVEFEDPWKVYNPGDIVKGNVVLTVSRGFDVTHLVVCLHGFAKVYKHRVIPGEGVPAADILANGKGSRGFEYHGNGLASLFQDEIVLCRSGFLKKQIYKFGFELEFPAQNLPSSIDFERGAISYIVTATLTKPTTISPTVSTFKPVLFQDSIEIENIRPAKEQVISLEPISKRGKPRKVRINPNGSGQGPPKAQLGRPEQPTSPAPSEETTVTTTSVSTHSFQIVDHGQNGNSSNHDLPSRGTSDARSSQTSLSSQTITASAAVLKQGALPGDIVPISISVSHVKPNVRGVVIATLYRQGRVDMYPAIPVGVGSKGKKAEYEDIYRRSKTGLGGLYFSNTSPNSVFRMDLSQSSTMMVIGPRILATEVKTSIRIPDDAFPTIDNVPGGMIAFNYFIEIVVDLCGKLGETRYLPRLTSSEPTFTQVADNGNQTTSVWADSILDTAQLRRTRNVVDFTFPVVIGTKDSGRIPRTIGEPQFTLETRSQQDYDTEYFDDGEWDQVEYDGHEYDYQYGEHGYEYGGSEGYFVQGVHHPPPADIIPPPQPEEAVDEKTRLRQQELLLFPSQPPQDGESSAAAASHAPSAPVLPLDGEIPGHAVPRTPDGGNSHGAPSMRSMDTIVPDTSSSSRVHVSDENHYRPVLGEDKQELERQRLLAQASAPPMDDDEVGPSRSLDQNLAPTAPPPSGDEEDYTSRALHHDNSTGDNLPRYER